MRRMALFIMLCAMPAAAHKASDSYLAIDGDGPELSGRWDIAIRDLAEPVGADVNGDGAITWGELRARKDELASWAFSRLVVMADGAACTARPGDLRVDSHSDGAYAVLLFDLQCAKKPAALEVTYRLLFDTDALHRGLFRLTAAGTTRTAVFSPQSLTQRFNLRTPAPLAQMAAFVREGVTHIWSGLDHILFLFALLLPSVLRRTREGWIPVSRLRAALVDAAQVVTAFTVAHSITLSASVLGVMRFPSRWVEAGIALSVAVAALDNLRPVFRARRWAVAFAFGLLHGFGFASVLIDLGLPRAWLLRALLSFNVGVELGQLAVVALFMAAAFALRRSVAYRRYALQAGSALILAIGSAWFMERVFGLRLLPWT